MDKKNVRLGMPIPQDVTILDVVGVNDANLRRLEAQFPQVNFWVSGEKIYLQSPVEQLELVCAAVEQLFTTTRRTPVNTSSPAVTPQAVTVERLTASTRVELQRDLDETRIDGGETAFKDTGSPNFAPRVVLANHERVIRPKTSGQARYVQAIDNHTVTFAIGPAGTGKTYLAMARAVKALLDGEVTRLILTRPAVEAGETLGFLPGTLTDKIDPYLRPLHDALREMLDSGTIQKMLSDGTIEVAALAYMRGRTLNGAFIILDEAQNTTSEQMKMFLTRLGFGSKMVVTGDITQIDLPHRQPSGLKQVTDILRGIPDVAISHLSGSDVVRHSLVADIIRAYDQFEHRHDKNSGRYAQVMPEQIPEHKSKHANQHLSEGNTEPDFNANIPAGNSEETVGTENVS